MDPMVLALVIMAITILCFIFEPLPLVVVSIAASLIYAFTGLIDIGDVFASYGTTTNILMVAMMVIGSSLFHSGISELIGNRQRNRRIDLHEIIVLERSGTFQHYFVQGGFQ